MDRGAWKAAVHGVAEGPTQLSDFTFTFHFHALEKAMPKNAQTTNCTHITRCCCCCVTSVVSDSVRHQRQQPTRLPRPWDSPGKNTGADCHFLFQCMKVKRESEVAQSFPTLHDPMVCSLPGSSIRGIFQARVLEWVAIAFSICLLMDI